MSKLTNKQKATGGILLFLSLLVGFGGGQHLTQEQFDNAFVCPTSEEVIIVKNIQELVNFECDDDWVSLESYIEENGLVKEKIIYIEKKGNQNKEICDPSGCYPLEEVD